MVRHRRLIVLLPIVLLLSSAFSCKDDPYRAAIRGSSDVSQAVSSGIKLTGTYYSVGTFNEAQKAKAANYFGIVTDCNMRFRKSIVMVHNTGQTGISAFLPIAEAFVSCVQNAAPVADDPTLANVLKATDDAIKGISLAISNAKGTK